MKAGSLRFRLFLAAATSIVAALVIAGIFLSLIFKRYVHSRIDAELAVHLSQLAGALTDEANNGKIDIAYELADPRFDIPLSGLYWQVSKDGKPLLRSRSLWDQQLPIPSDPSRLSPSKHRLIRGPGNKPLIALARSVIVETKEGEASLLLQVAVDQNEAVRSLKGFNLQIGLSLAVLAVVLVIAAWLQITVGLSPLRHLRERLNEMRLGTKSRLEGQYPAEVQQLVGELNALLEAQEQSMKRSRARAGDLAHGLKTPLAILAAESRNLRKRGQIEAAREIESQIETMRRFVERQLARTRARGRTGGLAVATRVQSSVERLFAAMKRLPRGDEIRWQSNVPNGIAVDLDPEDFDEVFGNLLDNARKFAKSEVVFRCEERGDGVCLSVEDDGCGIPEEGIAIAKERGMVLDGARSGSGLGLAIAQDVLETYGGRLELLGRKEGGLKAVTWLPKNGRSQRSESGPT